MAGIELMDGKMIEEFVSDDAALISAANKLFDCLDADADGHVDREELVGGLDALFCSSEDDDELRASDSGDSPVTRRQVFDIFDTSGRGRYVNRGEFQLGLRKLLAVCACSFAGTPVFVALHGEPLSLFAPVVEHGRTARSA